MVIPFLDQRCNRIRKLWSSSMVWELGVLVVDGVVGVPEELVVMDADPVVEAVIVESGRLLQRPQMLDPCIPFRRCLLLGRDEVLVIGDGHVATCHHCNDPLVLGGFQRASSY